ncbi:MAG TPA: hypothetical protein VFG69_20970 [Nannocystaceae bacterium]|nr:hypothetical protein [Nannocystaceae bacterium]
MGRALALLLTLVLGMLVRPAQGDVAHAADHSLERSQQDGDVANHERRPTVVQRFERPRTAGDETSFLDDDAGDLPTHGVESGASCRLLAALDRGAFVGRAAWHEQARPRGPPTA